MSAYIKIFSRFQDHSSPYAIRSPQNIVSPLVSVNSPKILLIDDDHIFCVVVSDMLTKAGYNVTTVLSGREALDLLEYEKDYDAIVLDRMMPELSGLDVLGKIALMPRAKNIPVIMLTSHAGKAQIQSAQAQGVFSLLYKPVDNQLLTSTVQRAIKEKNKKTEDMWD